DPVYASLAVGETLQIVANWTVTDGRGASDSSTLTINVIGTNDPPIAQSSSATDPQGGQLSATDPDSNATLTFSLDQQVPGLAISEAGSYTFNPSHPAYASIPEGETEQVIATWTVTDDKGASDTGTLTISVTGVNDPPVAEPAVAPDNGRGQLTASDPDRNATLSFTLDSEVFGFYLDENGSYTFDSSHPFYISLPQGETLQTVANWSVTDDKGASDTGTLTITVTGRNDPPVAEPAVAPSSGTGQLTAVDPDRNTTLSFTLGSQVAGLSLSQSGSYTFDNSDPAYTSLAGGETLRIVANWTVTDERGASDSSTLTITARGNNDPPVAVEATSDGSTTPDLASNGATFKLKWKHERNPISTLSGTLSFPANTITNAPNIDFESVPGSNLIIRSGEQIFNYPEPVIYFTSDSQVDFSKELVGQITDFNIFTSRFLGWGPSILEGRDGLYSLVSM
ncbi:MAG: VCBS domain-containing protein, partial [Verrucomicrobiota bacterium]|nr:VCBS domain-containing protein [Verrucomicrobiota bacterium]